MIKIIKKKYKPRIKARLRKMGLKKRLKPRIQARIRKNKQIINKKVDNFFDWIKGAELVELKECNTSEDPVRPELDNVFRRSYGRKIYGVRHMGEIHAVMCFAYTNKIPKPMVRINGKPIISYIIDHYLDFGVSKILIAGGYKCNVIKKYFNQHKKKYPNIKVINTGLNSLTGKRILKLKNNFKKNEDFFVTYGDGLSDINLKKLLNYHKKNKKVCTLTAVRPPARFGELTINNKNEVLEFKEKPNIKAGWINGGFFVIEPEFLNYIKNDSSILEREPLEQVAKMNQLVAFLHPGFWHCIDTKRDKDNLEEIIDSGKQIW